MADGVLTSSLEQTPCILFFGMQALPKNRRACVDIGFWQGAKASKMASSERVFSMQSFRSLSGITLMFNLSLFDLISVAEVILRVTELNIPSGFQPIMPSRQPRMKEYSEGIVFVSSKQSIFIYKSSQSEFICKSYSQYGLDRPET